MRICVCILYLSGDLFFEHEIDCEDEEDEGDEVVEAELLALEEDEREDGEDGEGDDLLNHLELDEAEGAVVAYIADAVGGDLAAILEKGNAPANEDDGQEGESTTPLCLRELQVPVPRQGHETV